MKIRSILTSELLSLFTKNTMLQSSSSRGLRPGEAWVQIGDFSLEELAAEIDRRFVVRDNCTPWTPY